MNILQTPVSATKKNAMFFDGLIATNGDYELRTYQDGEVTFEEKTFIGKDTPKLAEEDVHDVDLDAEVIVDIYVDKFFIIVKTGEEVPEEYEGDVFDDYDEAIQELENRSV